MANIADTGPGTGTCLDEQYYQVAAPRSWGERLAVVARDRIYADILRHCRPAPDETILDVGVSDVVTDAAICWNGNIRTRSASRPRVWAKARRSRLPIRRSRAAGSKPTGRCRSPTRPSISQRPTR